MIFDYGFAYVDLLVFTVKQLDNAANIFNLNCHFIIHIQLVIFPRVLAHFLLKQLKYHIMYNRWHKFTFGSKA